MQQPPRRKLVKLLAKPEDDENDLSPDEQTICRHSKPLT
jgi:hypothetical protein